MTRIALLSVLAAACGAPTSPPPEPLGNQPEPGVGEPDPFMPEGDYLCWGGFHEYLCTVQVVDGERRLDKVGGSDRYNGTITPDGRGGFRLVGRNREGVALDLSYQLQSAGAWSAQVPPGVGANADTYTIRHMGELGSVFGSQTYGGGYDQPEGD